MNLYTDGDFEDYEDSSSETIGDQLANALKKGFESAGFDIQLQEIEEMMRNAQAEIDKMNEEEE